MLVYEISRCGPHQVDTVHAISAPCTAGTTRSREISEQLVLNGTHACKMLEYEHTHTPESCFDAFVLTIRKNLVRNRVVVIVKASSQ